jgi:hypothetical protein
MTAPREVRCPACGRRGVPVESVQPLDRFCPYCGASYNRSARLAKTLLLVFAPVLAIAAIFGVLIAAGTQTAAGLFIVAVAGLFLWYILVRPGQG